MKTHKQIIQELSAAQIAVQKLGEYGFKVLSVAMGNLHPVITIQPPIQSLINKKLQDTQPISVRCRSSNPERIYAARFHGCMVTWAAELSNIKGAA